MSSRSQSRSIPLPKVYVEIDGVPYLAEMGDVQKERTEEMMQYLQDFKAFTKAKLAETTRPEQLRPRGKYRSDDE